MRCTHCGAMIPDDMLHCPECGMEVQIVPDYNPLEDVLAQEVKGSIEDATRQIRTDDIRRYRRGESGEYSNSTRVLSQGELDEIRARRNAAMRRGRQDQSSTGYMRRQRPDTGSMRQQRPDTGSMRQGRQTTGEIRRDRQSTGEMRRDRQSSGSNRQNTGPYRQNSGFGRQSTGSRERITEDNVREQDEHRRRIDADEKRRQQIARKKRLAKKRRQRALIIFLFFIILAGVLGFVLFQNSYTGQVRKGNQALQANDYAAAETYYKKAISKNEKNPEAYSGLSKVYSQQEDSEAAEAIFLTAISSQPDNVELYEAAIEFYMDSKQLIKISELLDGCEYEAVIQGVKPYVSEAPAFSLEEGTFDEVQQVSLASDSDTVYFTTDGSEPDTSSEKYTKPILLSEGTTVIKAIAVNKKKVPSLTSSKSYIIELPIADAPSVTPSTGQYDTKTQITITVPEGYTAFYTTDDSDPSDPAVTAQEYTGPIDMPNGQTMFSAVLYNNNSKKYTQVTKRNYVLEIAE